MTYCAEGDDSDSAHFWQGTTLLLEIEKLVYGGDALARLPADEKGRGKTVFVPFALPGELVEATIAQSRSGFARAGLDRVVEPSAERIEPPCPYFGGCGGCHYQHADYKAQLRYKTDILRETLRRTAKLEIEHEFKIHAAQPWHYRNRTRVRLRHTPDFALGYFRYSSHQLLPVEQCPISSPLINRAIAVAWQLGREGHVPASAHSLQFFADDTDKNLLIEAYCFPGCNAAECDAFNRRWRSALPGVVGVAFFTSAPSEDESRQWAPQTAPPAGSGETFHPAALDYHAAGHTFRVSAGSFFQTNRFLVDELVHTAVGDLTGDAALDLYAGVGLFTAPLASRFKDVTAVEASPCSFAGLRCNAPSNVNPHLSTTENFLQANAARRKFDFVMVDPPRAGLGEKTAAALGRTSASRVTYVSCDPATLSRDMRVLLECGFHVEQTHLVDMFPQTFHMETVLHLVR